jgi:cyclin L
MAPMSRLDKLSNALVTAKQLTRLHDGQSSYWTQDAQSIRFVQGELTQAAGVLLRLPQEVIANAIVILQRFWINFDDYEEDKVGCPALKRFS